jgi:hypothetical protein
VGKDLQRILYKLTVLTQTMLGGVPVPTAWRVLGLQMEERPPAMEGSCEYIEKAAADKRKGVVSSLGVGRWTNNPSP